MKTTHTPGPWYVKTEYANAKNQLDVCGDGLLIAECRDYGPNREMAEANARLIAAAPDLLAALEELLADKYLADPINADRMASARAALTKAKG